MFNDVDNEGRETNLLIPIKTSFEHLLVCQ